MLPWALFIIIQTLSLNENCNRNVQNDMSTCESVDITTSRFTAVPRAGFRLSGLNIWCGLPNTGGLGGTEFTLFFVYFSVLR